MTFWDYASVLVHVCACLRVSVRARALGDACAGQDLPVKLTGRTYVYMRVTTFPTPTTHSLPLVACEHMTKIKIIQV